MTHTPPRSDPDRRWRPFFFVPLTLLSLLGCLALFLQLDVSNTMITTLVNRLISPWGQVSNLQLHWPFRLSVQQMAISDLQGPWLELSDLTMEWSPLGMLSARMEAPSLDIHRVTIHRPPQADPSPSSSLKPAWLLSRIMIHTLVLDPSWVPGGATLRLEGRVQETPTERFELQARLERLDRGPAWITVQADLSHSSHILDIHAAAEERSGLLSSLTGAHPHAPWSISLNGAAPLQAWHGQLRLQGPDLGDITGSIAVQTVQDQSPSGQLLLDVPHLSPLSHLAGVALSGSVRLTARLDHSNHLPRILLTTRSYGTITIGPTTLTRPQTRARLHPLPQKPTSFSLSLLATAKELDTDPRTKKTTTNWPITQPSVSVNAKRSPSGLWHLDRFSAQDQQGTEMSGQGWWDEPRQQGEWAFRSSSVDLGSLPVSPDGGIHGPIGVSGIIRLQHLGDAIDFRLRGSGDQITGLPAGLAPWLGEHPRITINGHLLARRHLTLRTVRLHGGHGTVSARGKADLAEKTFIASLQTPVTNLASLPPIQGRTMAGRLQLTAQGGGNWNDPWMDLKLQGSHLAIPPLEIESLEGSFQGRHLVSAPSVQFRSSMRAKRERITLAGQAIWSEKKQTLILNDLLVTGPGSTLSGRLQVAPNTWLPLGQLRASVASLSALKPWHGLDLAGKVSLQMDMTQGRTQGRLDIDDLKSPLGKLRSGEVRWNAPLSPAGQATMTTHMRLHDFQSSKLSISSLELRGQGPWKKFPVTVDARGHIGKPFTLHTRGELQPLGDSLRIMLARLDGQLEGQKLSLQRPWEATFSPDHLVMKPWDVALGPTRIQGTFTRQKGRVEGQCRVQGELTPLHQLGWLPLKGDIVLTATVQGPEAAPDLTMNIQGRHLRHSTAAAANLPPFALQGELRITQGRSARMTLELSGWGQTPVRATAEMPVRVSAFPMAAQWRSQEPANGQIEAMAALSDLAIWLGLSDGQQLQGQLAAKFQANGSIDQPHITGTLQVTNGQYENTTFGTILKGVEVQARADGGTIIMDQIRLTDNNKGRIGLQGRWIMDRAKKFPLTITMEFDRAMIVDREDAKANVSGRLVLNGDIDAIDVRGRLTVHQALYQLNDLSGRPDMRVVAIRDRRQPRTSLPTPSTEEAVSHLDLQLSFPGNTRVRGRGLQSDWQGNLHVEGSIQEPRITGELEMRRGHLIFANRRYDLKQGGITFYGQFPPDPTIAVDAVTRTHDLEITAKLEGPATSPRLGFASVPSLPEDEILANLLFGRSSTSISPAQALKLAAMVQSLRNGGSGFVDGIEQKLGIDQLDFKGDSVETGSINAGKYVTEKLYLEVQKGMKADSDRINLEYGLTPDISLQTGIDAKSNADFGILWKKDY
ncbi:MAG: translocation/assembly module TamB domain-containing protein [Magnetococcales bacterium]|nr:translocation/assembly module TamB domain-containing protein [Magnetococcales bacterium]